MKIQMVVEGLKFGGMLMLIALPIGVAIGSMSDAELGVLAGYIIIGIGAVYRGYTYFEKYGPLFVSPNGEAFKNLFMYSLGFGLITAYPFTVISIFSAEGLNVMVLILYTILAIPFSGMKFIGAFAIGRFFNK
ncbi:MAG: hypothetical protein GY820_21345 [Gammaproteobacteria bacterium]|nr:hypothetical protein [Gammaproteobacteria bacterium]